MPKIKKGPRRAPELQSRSAELNSVDGGEELLALDGVGVHGLLAGGPVGGAHLVGVVADVLEGLQQTQGLVDAAAHGQVVDGALHDHTIGIDDEQTAQGHAGFLVEHLVGAGDVLLQVGHQGVGDVAEAAVLAVGLHPGQVGELAIHGHAQHFAVAAGEVGVAIGEGGDLRRADEGEVEGVEEQHHVLAAVLGQLDFLELLVNHCGGSEVRGLQTDQSRHARWEGVKEGGGTGSMPALGRSRTDYQLSKQQFITISSLPSDSLK